MAWILGSVSPAELEALREAGWCDENPPLDFDQGEYDGENAIRMFYVDSDVFTVMTGAGWEPGVANPMPEYVRDYTVLLGRPGADPTDTYLAHVKASDPMGAAELARIEVAEVDKVSLDDASTYYVLLVTHDHLTDYSKGCN